MIGWLSQVRTNSDFLFVTIFDAYSINQRKARPFANKGYLQMKASITYLAAISNRSLSWLMHDAFAKAKEQHHDQVE